MYTSSELTTKVPSYCEQPNEFQKRPPRDRITKDTNIPSVVEITTECGSCTGVVIGEGLFVTAAHCIEDKAKHIKAVFVNKSVSDLKLIKKGETHDNPYTDILDLAVLSGDTKGIPEIEIEQSCGVVQRCISFGYGMEQRQKISPCLGGKPNQFGVFIYIGKIDRGDSGGPVIGEAGKIIGIQTGIAGDFDKAVMFVIPSCVLYQFLSEALGEH